MKNATHSAKQLATGEEAKAESKWDTRSIEAGYLSSALEKRALELQQELQLLSEMDLTLSSKSKSVTIGSLVKLELNNRVQLYFLSPIAGGTSLNIDGVLIMVLSIFSPIGTQIIDLSEGDEFEIELNGNANKRTYKIIEIL